MLTRIITSVLWAEPPPVRATQQLEHNERPR